MGVTKKRMFPESETIINKGNITLYNTTLDQLDLNVIRSGHQCDTAHAFKETNFFHVLQYCTKGSGTLIIKNKEFPITAGTLFYLPINVNVQYFCEADDPYDYYWVCFNGESAGKLTKMAGLTSDTPCMQIENRSLANHFKHAYDVMAEKKPYMNCALLSDLFGIFDIAINHKMAEADKEQRSTSEQIQKAVQYMDLNFRYGISICDVCGQLFLNPAYFSTLFRKEMGCSPVKYLMGLRVEHASLLLRTTEMTISEIALQVGVSPLVLTSIFKKCLKVTPTQYRNDCKTKTIDIR